MIGVDVKVFVGKTGMRGLNIGMEEFVGLLGICGGELVMIRGVILFVVGGEGGDSEFEVMESSIPILL